MNITEIYNTEDMSIRSLNVCKTEGIMDLSSLLNYYRERRTFANVRNCGRRSNKELTEICLKYIDYEISNQVQIQKPENNLILITADLTRNQRQIINSFIEVNSKFLSQRSRNALTYFLEGNLKIKTVSEKILVNDRFDIQDIKNVGTKSVIELSAFITSIRGFVLKVTTIEDDNDLINLRVNLFIEKSFSGLEIPDEVYNSHSIFKLAEFLINQNLIFENKQGFIFKNGLKIYGGQRKVTSIEIASELNVTRERVRQLRNKCLAELHDKFHFIKIMDDNVFQKYGINKSHNFISVDDVVVSLINKYNNTNFSKEFISFLISVYFEGRFKIIGNLREVFQERFRDSKQRHNWCNFYLADINIISDFDFDSFVDDVFKRLGDRIEETYNFNFKSYITKFLKKDDIIYLSLIFPIAEKIINQEFDMFIDLNENVVFKRNTIKQVYEYAIYVLEMLGKPSKIEDIYNLIEKDFPQITKNRDALRGSLQKTAEIIYFGRSSTYGLKKWEEEKDNIKGGTIRQIVIEYLETYSTPKHFSEITSYVLKFRPKSNEYSITQNLKLDESRKFIFFKNSFVGVCDRNYDKSYILINSLNGYERRTWEERVLELEEFLKIYNRLPFSSGCPVKEIKLYKWYKIQLGKTKHGDLEDKRKRSINEIYIQFDNDKISQKRSKSNYEQYYRLKEFVLKKSRLPAADKLVEGNLHRFFNKRRKLFQAGHMLKDEERSFIGIAKIIDELAL